MSKKEKVIKPNGPKPGEEPTAKNTEDFDVGRVKRRK